MPVHAADTIGRHRAHDLGAEEMRLEPLAGAGGAARGDDDDIAGLEQPSGETVVG
jgi:hypothetical protein